MALDGLASSPELNGQLVSVLAFLVERGRYQVGPPPGPRAAASHRTATAGVVTKGGAHLQVEIMDGRQLAVLATRLRPLDEAEAAAAAELRRSKEEAEVPHDAPLACITVVVY